MRQLLFRALGVLGGALSAHAYKLPTEPLRFEKLRPPSARVVMDADGKVLDYWYGQELRLYRPRSEIDAKLIEYLVFLEDAKFWTHKGFDVEEIKNSLKENLKEGEIRRGGSTITQQLVKNLFLDKERSLVRKIFEIPWAVRVENDLSKSQILELYLNEIEWGPGVYGAEAAARHYFDREVRDLELGQAMYLALIVPGPKKFDLFAHPRARSALESRRDWLVNRLVAEKKIPATEKASYLTADFALVAPDAPERRFPLSHNADYAGNRQKRSRELKKLEENLSKLSSKSEVRLSLKYNYQKLVFELPESDDPEAIKETLYALYENDKVRALRFVKKGKALALGPLDSSLDSEGSPSLVLQKVEKFSWKSLLL